MSRVRLGLGIGAAAVRGVLLHGSACVWKASVAVPPTEEGLRTALRELLASVPRSRLLHRDAVVALGPAAAVYKRLEGMHADADASMVTSATVANADRFFRFGGGTLKVAVAHRINGAWWAWAAHKRCVAVVLEECRRCKIRVGGFVPTVAALGLVNPNGTFAVHDGDRHDRVSIVDGVTTAVVPVRSFSSAANATDQPDAEVPPEADAHAAALTPLTAPLVWNPDLGSRIARNRLARVGAMLVIIVASCAAALSAPLLRPLIASWIADDVLSPAQRAAARATESRLREHLIETAAIESIRAFASSRRSVLRRLVDITGALPDSSAVVALRLDANGASIVALTPSGSSVLPALAALNGVASARLIGAVTRESIQGYRVQRVAAELTFAASDAGNPHTEERIKP